MLFNSYIFIFAFFPIVFCIYFLLNHLGKFTIAKGGVIVGSLVFYGYYNWSYLLIIIMSTVFNYFFGNLIIRRRTKGLMILGIIINIGVLFYFKYFNFFIDNINIVFNIGFTARKVILPLGISFYTFQQVSYIVDCYKDEVEKYTFIDYMFFVTFFPQLIAGPIVLHSEIIPQINDGEKKRINFENLSKGFFAFTFGLGKKVLIADTLGMIVDAGYANIVSLSSLDAILVMLAYSFQIFFDFSGYCDMALGIAKMFNVDIPLNFASPYKSYSINEFWSRWHITLTRFFRTYVYIPLGGNRKGKFRQYLNIMTVFLISGLWHGADWSFVLWGGIHGALQVLNKIFEEQWNKVHLAIQWFLTFLAINIAWIFFRAESISDGLVFIKQMLHGGIAPISVFLVKSVDIIEVDIIEKIFGLSQTGACKIIILIVFLIAFIGSLNAKNIKERLEEFKPSIISAVVTSVIFVYSVLSLSGVNTFLYFGF